MPEWPNGVVLKTDPASGEVDISKSVTIVGGSHSSQYSSSRDAELERLVANWGSLPEIVRKGILAMVDGVLHDGAHG